MRRFLTLAGLVLAAVATSARPAEAQLGLGARWAKPHGDFGDAYKSGIGGYAKYEVRAIAVGVAAEVNVTRFSGQDGVDDITVFGGQVGPRLGLGLLRLGFDIGWHSEIKKVDYSPNVTADLGPIEGAAGLTFFKGGSWLYLRAGLAL